MTKIISVRIDSGLAARLDKTSKKLNLDKTGFVRIVLTKGLKELEKSDALDSYKRGEISLGKLSELVDMNYWDTLDLLSSEKIPLNYGKEDFKEDTEYL
ncbi:UPF0175 family protein [Candidatus Peregrinibacteria bacterium]|nr:UPF0175 family protein [Candidatus Peregrinibacteria bacterium]